MCIAFYVSSLPVKRVDLAISKPQRAFNPSYIRLVREWAGQKRMPSRGGLVKPILSISRAVRDFL